MSCQGPTLVSEGGGSILAGTAPVGTVGRHELVAQGSSMGLGSGVAAQGSRMGLGSGVEAQGSSMGLGSSMTARTAARSSSASITTLQKSVEKTTMNMEATLDLFKDSSTFTWARKCEVKAACKARTKSLDRGLFNRSELREAVYNLFRYWKAPQSGAPPRHRQAAHLRHKTQLESGADGPARQGPVVHRERSRGRRTERRLSGDRRR